MNGDEVDAHLDRLQAEGRAADALTDWWLDVARTEVEAVAPKAVEYGSTDLGEIGRTLAACMNRPGLDEAERAELGVYFYLVGKMARWTDAVVEGRRVSDDTLHDVGVYVRMAQRIRAVGGWPFAPEGDQPEGGPEASEDRNLVCRFPAPHRPHGWADLDGAWECPGRG